MTVTNRKNRFALLFFGLVLCLVLSSFFTMTAAAQADKNQTASEGTVIVPVGNRNYLDNLDMSKFILLGGLNRENTSFENGTLSVKKNIQTDAPLNGFVEGFACFHSLQPMDSIRKYVLGATVAVGACYDEWTYRAASVIFMANDNYNKYYQYAIWKDKVVLIDSVGGRVIAEKPFSRVENKPYAVEVEVSGDTVTIYQDGNVMFDSVQLGTVYGQRIATNVGYAEASVSNYFLYATDPLPEHENLAYFRHSESNFDAADGYEPWKALDGRAASRWASVYAESERPSAVNPLTFTVDLGSKKEFTKLVLTEYMNGDEFTSRMVQYDVSVSSDLVDWDVIQTIDSGDTGIRNLQDYTTTITFDRISARYLRLSISAVTFPPTLIELALYDIPIVPPEARDVTITGKSMVGETLYGEYEYYDANGDPESETTFIWSKADSVGGVYTPITMENAQTYRIQESDLNSYIKFSVCPKSDVEDGIVCESMPLLIDGDWQNLALERYDTVWNTPAKGEMDSMPLGNGDIGANVWITSSGALEFYISKTDAFDNNGRLIKVGKVVVELSNNPFVGYGGFSWRLDLSKASIVVSGRNNTVLSMWIDANHPTIEMSIYSDETFTAQVAIAPWRTVDRQITSDGLAGWGQGEAEPWNYNEQKEHADTIVEVQDTVLWYYRNIDPIASNGPELRNRTMGAVISGDGLLTVDNKTLQSSSTKAIDFSVTVLTATTDTAQMYVQQLLSLRDSLKRTISSVRKTQHNAVWADFWAKSHIYITGANDAYQITRGYILQRYLNACAGRGLPIKFNGSIFNVAEQTGYSSPDYRLWGSGYWWQNTRLIYWPMLASGDTEMMLPLFEMYSSQLNNAIDGLKQGMGYDGAAVFEEGAAYGKGVFRTQIDNDGANAAPALHAYYQILELSAMMLHYYQYTDDQTFLTQKAIPMAQAGLNFYYQNFKRDLSGKLKLYPTDCLETYYAATNSLVEVAAIHDNLSKLLALPDSLTTGIQRRQWTDMLSVLPDIPMRLNGDGEKMLSPAEIYDKQPRNVENPELYALFPFDLYGMGRPDLSVASRAFDARINRETGSWQSDAIFAAMVGKTQEARDMIYKNYTYRSEQRRFAGFLDGGFDWAPGQDGGSVASDALQKMIMQPVGNKLLIAPSLPKDWCVDFKLAAPQNTTVEASYRNGKIKWITVTPSNRAADVFIIGEDTEKPYDICVEDSLIFMQQNAVRTVSAQLVNYAFEPVAGSVTWSSSDESVAEVRNGVIQSKNAGEVFLTVSNGQITKKIHLQVRKNLPQVEPSDIRMDVDEINLDVGKSLTINAEVFDGEGRLIECAKILWASVNHNIAKVKNGVVTAVKEGRTEIVATFGGITKKVKIVVSAPKPRADNTYLYVLLPLALLMVGGITAAIIFVKIKRHSS